MELWQVRAASKILNWGKDWTWGVLSGVAYQKLLLCEREETKNINKLVPIKVYPNSGPAVQDVVTTSAALARLVVCCSARPVPPLSPSLTSAVPKVAPTTPGRAAGRLTLMSPRAFLPTFPAHPHTPPAPVTLYHCPPGPTRLRFAKVLSVTKSSHSF